MKRPWYEYLAQWHGLVLSIVVAYAYQWLLQEGLGLTDDMTILLRSTLVGFAVYLTVSPYIFLVQKGLTEVPTRVGCMVFFAPILWAFVLAPYLWPTPNFDNIFSAFWFVLGCMCLLFGIAYMIQQWNFRVSAETTEDVQSIKKQTL